jgi:hypothetical protein
MLRSFEDVITFHYIVNLTAYSLASGICKILALSNLGLETTSYFAGRHLPQKNNYDIVLKISVMFKVEVFCIVMPCSIVIGHHHFWRTLLQGT